MKTRDEVQADLSVLLDKPVLTIWEVGQAIRILAGVMLDLQDAVADMPRLVEHKSEAANEIIERLSK